MAPQALYILVVSTLVLAQVGFPQRDPSRLQLALDHSHSVLWIRSMKQSRWARKGQLLGFARATSDGALSATIWDVAVSCKPDYNQLRYFWVAPGVYLKRHGGSVFSFLVLPECILESLLPKQLACPLLSFASPSLLATLM